jgi:hypothetical protein
MPYIANPRSNQAPNVRKSAKPLKLKRFKLWPELVFAGGTIRCRSCRADISASGAAGGAKLFRSGLQGRPFHAEASSGAGGPSDHPISFPQRPQDMLAFSGFQASRDTFSHQKLNHSGPFPTDLEEITKNIRVRLF